MTTEEFYTRVEGDWAGILRRLGSVDRVDRFLRMVPKDPTFQSLTDAMERGDVETAFRSAHSLKGLGLNLGLTRLADAASALTESLRGGAMDGAPPLYQAVQNAYDITIATLKELEGGIGNE